ncbi:MAG: electron transfer flavoprotein beta subunit/FixA family protein, partial [Thermodesulfobacteriota bacterium]|nr:electron transfer flavoprotein beta subunit/FixA family protein [Thermodesulfobacteriota bacterium]
TKNEGYQSPFITAARIASYAQDKAYDLILTGVMAEDDMQGQVGPILAELLNLPWATSVILAQVRPNRGTVSVEREIEGGRRDMLSLELPALLTIQTGINKPRYPSLSNLLRAKKQKPETIDAAELNAVEGREELVRVGYPQKSRSGLVLSGGRQEKAAALFRILREKSFI